MIDGTIPDEAVSAVRRALAKELILVDDTLAHTVAAAGAPHIAADALRMVEKAIRAQVKELRATGIKSDYVHGMEDAAGGIRLALDGVEAMLKGRT